MAIFIKKANYASIGAVNRRKNFYSSLTENFRLWRFFKFDQSFNKGTKHIFRIATEYADDQLKIVKYNAQARLLIAIFAMLFCILILNIMVEFAKLELTTIAFFALIFIRLIPLGQKFNLLLSGFAKLEPSLSLVTKALKDANSNVENVSEGLNFNGNFSKLEFNNVHYKYPHGTHKALENINLTVRYKEITAIVGKSGAGKSTLIDLIPRIIYPSSGDIFLDGININKYSLSSIRKSIAFIYQDSVLYDTSIKNNIKYFNIEASEAEFNEVCKLSGVSDFIDTLPGKYDYNVSESGQKLSGGQKQRVILARAFLSHAKILILDEATSALDNESERNIKVVIRNMVRVKDKTVIVIAHRRNTIKDADFVIYIKNGAIENMGKPQEIFAEYPNL